MTVANADSLGIAVHGVAATTEADGDASRKVSGIYRIGLQLAGGRFVQLLIWGTTLAGLAIGEAAQPLTLLFSATSISLVVILWRADRSRCRMLKGAIERLTREAHVFASGQDRAPMPRRPMREP